MKQGRVLFHVKQFTSKTQKTGELGESIACNFLVKNGFSIVERNVANAYGEIDIVAKKAGTWYFFEVKAGKRGGVFNPADNLTPAKLRKYYQSVQYYAMVHRISQPVVQALVVYLDGTSGAVEVFDLAALW